MIVIFDWDNFLCFCDPSLKSWNIPNHSLKTQMLPQFDLPRIPDLLMEKYQSIGASFLKEIESSLKEDVKVENDLKAIQGQRTTSSAATTGSPTPSRTHGSPDWNGEVPVNFRKRISIDAIPVTEFEASNTFLGYLPRRK